MAYCGARWNDLKKWFLDNQDVILEGIQEDIGDAWDQKLLKSIFRCWLKLFIKKDWYDLSQIGKEIINLRQSKKNYEERYFMEAKDSQQSAFLLIALYNLSPLYNFCIKNVIQDFLMYNKFAYKIIRKKVVLYDKLIIQ